MGRIGYRETYNLIDFTYTPVIQPEEYRLWHTAALGGTGTGKTSLLQNLAIDDIHHGKGVGVIDPHGDFAERILNAVPPERFDDVVYFDPSDFDRPISWNPLYKIPLDQQPRVADGLLYAIHSAWPDTYGESRMQFLLLAAALPLLEEENQTILGVTRFVNNEYFRNELLKDTKNYAARDYWQEVFDRYKDQIKDTNTAPIFHHVGQLGLDFVTRNILGQVKNKLSIKDIMDGGKIFIANLSKGHIGHLNSKFLGSLLMAEFQLAAMARANTPEEERRDFFLYVDEFQNFATESFESILSEARKYHLGLILANQYLKQIPEGVRGAIEGNVGTRIFFRMGREDALEVGGQTEATPQELLSLINHEAYVRLPTKDGAEEYKVFMDAPDETWVGGAEEIKRRSRMRYGRPRAEVEDKLKRWYGGGKHEPRGNSKRVEP